MIYRDEFTQGLQGYYTRRVFFGDMKLSEVPKDKQEQVKKELEENGLKYMI